MITQALTNETADVRFNGGFYTISTNDLTAQQVIAKLITSGIPVTYFRDITNSAKRFF
jgi:ABC-2 type transport system ATP-binding protein